MTIFLEILLLQLKSGTINKMGDSEKLYSKNIVFQEEYKRLDALCKDIFASREGVSEYIRQMELVSYADRRYYADWESDYRQLKHLRWIRNRLAHDVGTLEEEFCTDAEIEWLKNFHQKILSLCDPLSTVQKNKKEFDQKNKQYRVYHSEQNIPKKAEHRDKKQRSICSKFIAKVKNLFTK